MFGIGFPELIVICIVALIFIGPKKLPDLMRQGGKLFVQLRRTANDVRSTFDQVVHEAEEEMRKSEAEALRQAILADHVKAPKLLDAATGTGSPANDTHDHDMHHHHDHDHADHHHSHHDHLDPHGHDHDHHHHSHHDHQHTPLAESHDSVDAHRPEGAQPFQPNLLEAKPSAGDPHKQVNTSTPTNTGVNHSDTKAISSDTTKTSVSEETPAKPKDDQIS